MDTKEELVTRIRDWIAIDNEITKLQKQIKGCREEKNYDQFASRCYERQ